MDLKVIETGNGGDIVKTTKDLVLVSGFQNMIYLALFGGNIKASTPQERLTDEQAFDWWGNSLLFPNKSDMQFNSLTERTLREVALTSSGRRVIEEAVVKDLLFMKSFAEVSVSVIIPGHDKVQISIKVSQPGNLQEKKFVYIWDSTKNELTVE